MSSADPRTAPGTTSDPLTPPTVSSPSPTDGGRSPALDPRFVCDFRPTDDPGDGQRFSTWLSVEPLCRGPEPRPDWVVTSQAAVDTDLGVLKTGKEADVFLLERAVSGDPSQAVVMAAKRYRDDDHRGFHRSAVYTEGRRTRRSRDARAVAKKTAHGRAVAAGQWAAAEWDSLARFWSAGVPVPYPVQIDGTEILMELFTPDGAPAPRLAQTRPDEALLGSWFEQLRDAMATLARLGVAHGDLSPYNVLAAGERLVVIDVPQAVDLAANPSGPELLLRDCHNVCSWFAQRGLDVDEHALFGELLAAAW
jgi:RIO kinase 1